MGNESAIQFTIWALTHARPNMMPSGAVLAAPADRCGTDPWEYLSGQSGRKCTRHLLDALFKETYEGFGWEQLAYETVTHDWPERGVCVCDGPGLLNAYVEQVLKTSCAMTAHGIYSRLCRDRAEVGETNRAFELGEAVFVSNRYGTKKRVGWVCGFDAQGEPLIIEARGLCYGVCIAPFHGRGWTHRARMEISFNGEGAYAD